MAVCTLAFFLPHYASTVCTSRQWVTSCLVVYVPVQGFEVTLPHFAKKKKLTFGLVPKLLANYIGFCRIPVIITYSAPSIVGTDLNSSFKGSWTIHQSHIAICTVGVGRTWNWNHTKLHFLLQRLIKWNIYLGIYLRHHWIQDKNHQYLYCISAEYSHCHHTGGHEPRLAVHTQHTSWR